MASEYYDFDAERRRRRSLAEESLSEQMLGLTRVVGRSVALLRDIVISLYNGDEAKLKELHTRCHQVKEQAESMKEDALAYLARLGDILVTGSLYRDVFLNLVRAAQLAEGVAYRAYVMASNSNLSSETIRELLLNLASTINEEFENLEAAIQLLAGNPRKGYEKAQSVSVLEDRADDIYRKLTLAMYKELYNDIVALMLLKDIAEMAEDIADVIRDAAEDVKFMALRQAQTG